MHAHLRGTQLPKIDEANHLLHRISPGPTTPPPQIPPCVRHLEQPHAEGPHRHMHGQQSISNMTRNTTRRVGLFDAAEISADGEGVENERDEGDGEEHEDGPEGGGGALDGGVVAGFVGFGGVVFDEGVDHGAGDEEGEEGGEEALDETEGADAAFDLHEVFSLGIGMSLRRLDEERFGSGGKKSMDDAILEISDINGESRRNIKQERRRNETSGRWKVLGRK